MQTMTLDQLRAAASAGGVVGVTVKGAGAGFFIEIDTRSGHGVVLSKARGSEPRRFCNPTSALVLLRELGIVVSKLDTTEWDPSQREVKEDGQKRSQTMREAHAAAAHTKWLAQSIEESIDDPRPSITHDEVMTHMEERIANFRYMDVLPGSAIAKRPT